MNATTKKVIRAFNAAEPYVRKTGNYTHRLAVCADKICNIKPAKPGRENKAKHMGKALHAVSCACLIGAAVMVLASAVEMALDRE